MARAGLETFHLATPVPAGSIVGAPPIQPGLTTSEPGTLLAFFYCSPRAFSPLNAVLSALVLVRAIIYYRGSRAPKLNPNDSKKRESETPGIGAHEGGDDCRWEIS
jgi:hypothetical protein